MPHDRAHRRRARRRVRRQAQVLQAVSLCFVFAGSGARRRPPRPKSTDTRLRPPCPNTNKQTKQQQHGRVPRRRHRVRHPQHPDHHDLQGRQQDGDGHRRRAQVDARAEHREVPVDWLAWLVGELVCLFKDAAAEVGGRQARGGCWAGRLGDAGSRGRGASRGRPPAPPCRSRALSPAPFASPPSPGLLRPPRPGLMPLSSTTNI